MTSITEQIKTEIIDAIRNDRLTLPTLPEIALQVREAANDPDVSVASLGDVLSNDAALTARVIKVANSPLLRGSVAVEDVKMAVSRLGVNYTANLATGLAMEQMFQATSDVVDQRMRDVWSRSTEVASIAHVLCKHYTNLSPDQATLSGLIHKIGVLPILRFAEEEHDELLADPVKLDLIINELNPAIGTLILKTWDFNPDVVNVPREHLIFNREVAAVDYADLVMVANLQSYLGSDHPYCQMDWSAISAFKRVGLESDTNAMEAEDLSADMEAAMAMLAS